MTEKTTEAVCARRGAAHGMLLLTHNHYLGVWTCYCRECGQDYHDETGTPKYAVGEGRTESDAVQDYADLSDVSLSDIVHQGEKHV
jgi:hypothetical protein